MVICFGCALLILLIRVVVGLELYDVTATDVGL